jgi:SAM-dependent methyltransferase
VTLVEGMAQDPPFDPGSFDRVVSSLVFHHMTLDDERRGLAAIHRLLKPGDELHLADWGNPRMRSCAWPSTVFTPRRFETTRANVEGRIPELMRGAGLEEVAETHREMTLFGALSFYRGTKPL